MEDNERGKRTSPRRRKNIWERDGNSEPFRGQAVPEKDTINRRNRMKLRCVRGGERKRVGGGESDRESLTQGKKRERDWDCVMQTSLQTSLSTSSDTRWETVCTLRKMCVCVFSFSESASSPQTTIEFWIVWRRERRWGGVGGVFETSHIQPGADRQQRSGRAVHGWFCVWALMFHILTHACKHIHTHRGPLWVYLFGQCRGSDRQFTMSHCRRNVLLTNGCSARTAGHREDP